MIGIAAVVGAVSIFAADMWVRSATQAQRKPAEVEIVAAAPPVELRKIVVAAEPLRFGAALSRDTLKEISWPQDSLPEGAFASIDAALKGGRAVLSPIEPNEPVLKAKLSGPDGRATLSNLLTPGMRAVTIRTDEIAGVGGFVAPGDRVDVVLTRDAGRIAEVSGNAEGASGSTIATEIVVANAKVLTVGQGADERATGPQLADSVTIEVTAEGAQKVALARNVGSLSLSLRSAADAGSDRNGLTTISAFGGSVGSGAAEKASALFGAIAAEPETSRMTTVIVTRGTVAQSYQVVSPGE